jgi:hypothetical protein
MDLELYRPRSVRFLELWQYARWRLKLYAIARDGVEPDAALIDSAKTLAPLHLPPAFATRGGINYGVGFVGVHRGHRSNVIFVDWWAEENELRHHVYASDARSPTDLTYVTPDGFCACVWDLALIAFERDAWVDTVLREPGPAALDNYLARRASGER